MKNVTERIILFWFSFYSLFRAWKINLPSTEQAVKTKPKQIVLLSFFIVFDCSSVV